MRNGVVSLVAVGTFAAAHRRAANETSIRKRELDVLVFWLLIVRSKFTPPVLFFIVLTNKILTSILNEDEISSHFPHLSFISETLREFFAACSWLTHLSVLFEVPSWFRVMTLSFAPPPLFSTCWAPLTCSVTVLPQKITFV